MATPPKGKKPAPLTTPKKPAKPAARNKAAGSAAPAQKATVKPTGKKQQKTPAQSAELGLTDKQQRFVDEYMVDLNATQAAIRAGYSPNAAAEQGYEHLRKPHIQLAIAEARKKQQERTGITADRVLREIAAVAMADARELVEVRTGCCRCCWGEANKRQRTLLEINSDREKWLDKGNNPADFDEEGGIGFDPRKAPNAECPSCGGDGQPRTVLKDTRYLSESGIALYAGAKQTKDGIEIKMHSKLDAIEKLAKHLGVYEKDNQQKADPLSAILARVASGNGNGFIPVQDDPERKASSMPVRHDVSDDED